MSLRSRRRIFIRKRRSPALVIGVLALVFVGSFGATIIGIDWPSSAPLAQR